MKRILVAMTLMGTALVVASGVAWALTVNCQVRVPCVGTNDPDELIGTKKADDMNALHSTKEPRCLACLRTPSKGRTQ